MLPRHYFLAYLEGQEELTEENMDALVDEMMEDEEFKTTREDVIKVLKDLMESVKAFTDDNRVLISGFDRN